MSSTIDTSCEHDILDTSDKVFGLIYEITNNETGMKYVGQTVSHRKNKGKYRPFGIVGRLNDHISEAVNNTKRKQCSYLNNAIRKNGKDAFVVDLIELCPRATLDEREQHFIKARNTLFPSGYNLTKGGKTSYIESFISDLQTPKQHGGCTSRTLETRAKMSARAKERSTEQFCDARASAAIKQHHDGKLIRFANCKVELEKMDSYIRKKGSKVCIIIDGVRAEFANKDESIEELKERARMFIKELNDATLSNCGEPVKHE